jgi:hypothetical protein
VKKLVYFLGIVAALYFGSAFYMRSQTIALVQQGCAAGEAAGLKADRCLCFAAILKEEMPLLTFWTNVTGADLGIGMAERAEARARQECPV